MNKVILMGRLTRDPDVRYSQSGTAVARYTLAVDRRFARGGEGGSDQQTADFISCVAFGRSAEFAEKYLHQGTKIVLTGRIQTGSYTNRDGQKVYTTDILAEDQEFAESKKAAAQNTGGDYRRESRPQFADPLPSFGGAGAVDDDFMNIPDGVDDEGLPFD